MRLRQKKLIWDVLENSKAALRYLSGLDFEAFCSDDKTQAAVERPLEIAGEALNRLREIDEASLSEQIPDYFRIIGLRNHIAHGYDNVDLATLWDAAANHTPQLIAATQSWLENADMVP